MSESIKNLLKRAEQGDAQSQFLAGMLYENGLGIAKDEILAQAWYRKAAAQGHREAKQKLEETIKPSEQVTAETQSSQAQTENQYGSALLEGISWGWTSIDGPDYSEEYRDSLSKAINQGNASALYKLGYFCHAGLGITQNYQKALEWYRRAAIQGIMNIQGKGFTYKDAGISFSGDIPDSKWFDYGAATSAQNNIGYLYQYGQGVPQNYQKAFEWYRKAAELGLQTAQYNLGLMYANGHGIPQNYQQAREWIRKAANQGLDEAKKLLKKLPTSSQQTASSQPNRNKTLKELLEESGGNHSAADRRRMAQSAYMMARMSLSGTGLNGRPVEKNARAAFDYMQYAADNGLAEAQCDLAILYSEGIGTRKDDAKALEWFKKSADQGYPLAMHNVAAYYLNTLPRTAFEWYFKAAQAGHERSQIVVALMYLKGTGVPQNMTQAIGWLQKAASQGSEEALQLLARLVL